MFSIHQHSPHYVEEPASQDLFTQSLIYQAMFFSMKLQLVSISQLCAVSPPYFLPPFKAQLWLYWIILIYMQQYLCGYKTHPLQKTAILQHPEGKGNIINDSNFQCFKWKNNAQQTQQPNTHALRLSKHAMEKM